MAVSISPFNTAFAGSTRDSAERDPPKSSLNPGKQPLVARGALGAVAAKLRSVATTRTVPSVKAMREAYVTACAAPASQGKYQKIYVIDDFDGSYPGSKMNLNSQDTVGDVYHGEVVARLIEALVNPGRERSDPAFQRVIRLPVTKLNAAGQPTDERDPSGIRTQLQRILAEAPKDAKGRADLRGVAVNISLHGPNPPELAAAFKKLVDAGAEVYVIGMNTIEFGPSRGNALLNEGPRRLIGVTASDGIIGQTLDKTPSKENPPSQEDRPEVDAISNGVLRTTPLQEGVDFNNDGIVEVKWSEMTPVPKAQIERLQGLRLETSLLTHEALTHIFTRDANYHQAGTRQAALALLKDRVVTVEEARRWGNFIESAFPTPFFDTTVFPVRFTPGPINRPPVPHSPLPDGVDPRKVYVSLYDILQPDASGNYVAGVPLFESDERGGLRLLSNRLPLRSLPANSYAAPNELGTRNRR
jgi:hypothetical protein